MKVQSPEGSILAQTSFSEMNTLISEVDLETTQKKDSFFTLSLLFDQLVAPSAEDKYLMILKAIVVILQFIPLIPWATFPGFFSSDNIIGRILFYFDFFALYQYGPENNLSIVRLLVPFCIFIVMLVYIIFIYFWVKLKGTLKPIMSFFLKFFCHIVLLFQVIPLTFAFTSTFSSLPEKNPIAIAFFIIFIPCLVISILLVYYTTQIFNGSLTPSSHLNPYDSSCFTYLYICSGIVILGNGFSVFFESWFKIIIIIFQDFGAIISLYYVLSFPFLSLFNNSLFASIPTSIIGYNVINIIALYVHIPDYIKIIIAFFIANVSFIFYRIFFGKKSQKILNLLNEEEENIKVTSLFQANSIIHVGFSNLHMKVINGIIPIQICKQMKNDMLWAKSAALIAIIPSNRIQLQECIDALSINASPGLLLKLLRNRLIHIQQNRETFETVGMTQLINEMEIETNNSIDIVRQFWKEIADGENILNPSTLTFLYTNLKSLKIKWKEILKHYPSDPRLAQMYSRFLIECLGKYEKGVYWNMKSKLLNKGYRGGNDELFHSFVILNPRIYYEKIVDKNGNLLEKADVDSILSTIMSTSTTHTTFMESVQQKLAEEIGNGESLTIASKLFSMPRLRYNLEKATKNYTPNYYNIFKILKIIIFIVWIIVCIVLIFVATTILKGMIGSYERNDAIANIKTGLSYLKNIIYLKNANLTNILFTMDDYVNLLTEEAINEDNLAIDLNDYKSSYEYWSDIIINNNNLIYSSLTKYFLEGDDLFGVLDALTLNNISKVGVNISLRNAFLNIFWDYTNVYQLDIVDDYNFEVILTSQESMNRETIYIIDDLMSAPEMYNRELSSYSNIIIIILGCYAYLIALPVCLIQFYIVYSATKKFFNAIDTLSTEYKDSASKPICYENDESNTKNKSRISKNRGNLIGYMIAFGIIFALFFVLFVITVIITRSELNKSMNIINLAIYGSYRESIITEILSFVQIKMYNKINSISFSTVTDEDLINLVNDYSNQFTEFHSKFSSGIYSIVSEIESLHLDFQCSSTDSDNIHLYFTCNSLEHLFDLYLSYAKIIINDDTSNFLTQNYISLLHLAIAELHRGFTSSASMLSNYFNNYITTIRLTFILILLTVLIFVIILWFLNLSIENRFQNTLNSVLILIRHLPPPAIAETPELKNLLLSVKTNGKDEILDTGEITFNSTEIPIICIGEGYIIESCNQMFQKTFDYLSEQIVGHKLTLVIENPNQDDTEMSIEEQGAFHMYDKIKTMFQTNNEMQCSYPVNVINSNGDLVSTYANVFPVIDKKHNKFSNFIISFTKQKSNAEETKRINKLKETCQEMEEQLIPKNLVEKHQNEEINFTVKTVTVVAIQNLLNVYDEETINISEEGYKRIHDLALKYPNLVKVNFIHDTAIFASGVIDQENAEQNLKSIVDFTIESAEIIGSGFKMALFTGGPLLCATVVSGGCKQVQCFGSVINDVILMLTTTEKNEITVDENTKQIMGEKYGHMLKEKPNHNQYVLSIDL